MEPKLPAPNFGSERSPRGYEQKVEQLPYLPNPERAIESGKERMEQQGEQQLASTPIPSAVLPTPIAVPTPPLPVKDDHANGSSATTSPLVANDDDLIEKEWVDKAKAIIVDTKDDPYRREEEVSKLQVDYLRKRYGRELGNPQ